MGWTMVYRHNGKGEKIEGDFNVLKEAVLNGHDVKVLVEEDDNRGGVYVFKTDFVFANDDFICAQNPYGGVSVDKDTDNTLKWKKNLYNWMVIACTKGYLDIIRPILGSNELCPGKDGKEHNREHHTMKWFVDI